MIDRMRMIGLAALALALAGSSGVGAQTGAFPQVASADLLRAASGILHDVTVLDAAPHWTVDGEWTLFCRAGTCAASPLENIQFDLSIIMVRPDGTSSHTHSFSDFVAEAVELSPDLQTLTIGGTITAPGVIGTTGIVIQLIDVGGNGNFLVELPGNGHLADPVGGAISVSR